ncbi:MAG TPA: hypothetical protein VFX38_04405 [Gammaproteobacteria bacterium]|nr:hypothetical protein [Gammaproteobacteria bacterium]
MRGAMKQLIVFRSRLLMTQVKSKRRVARLKRAQRQGKSALHFLHMGKTGGTAIKHALRPFPVTGDYVIYLHHHGFGLRDVPQGEGVILFLRDPISRFVSGFLSRQRQGRPRYFTPWTPGERQAFRHFRSPNDLGMALSSPDAAEKSKAEAAMRSITHVGGYAKWLGSEDYLASRLADMYFVGLQESLQEDFELLKVKLGEPRIPALPTDPVSAHRSDPGSQSRLESAAIENLKQWYREDYGLLAQCKRIRER